MLARSRRLGKPGAALAIAVGSVMALGLAACGSGGASEVAGTAPSTSGAGVVPEKPGNGVPPALVGDWLGPWPSTPAGCSPEYVEWFIYATGSYSDTWNSEPLQTVPGSPGTTTTAPQYRSGCEGGDTAYGTYSVQGNLLTFHQQSVPTCPACTQQQYIPVTFYVSGQDLRLCDYPSGGCWDYAKQQGRPGQNGRAE